MWLAVLAALAVAGFTGTAASAERSNGTQSTLGTAGGSGLTLPGLDGERYRITLITGDVIELTAAGGGRYTLEVEPAARPDGSAPAVEVSGTGDELYAVPDDVQPYLASGRLDKKLFNVSYLAANGYANPRQGLLPVIVEYAERLTATVERRRAQALPASDLTAMLESIDAAALRVSKANADAFWASLRDQDQAGAKAPSFETGVTKVWLDRAVKLDLSESVPQVGAPDAWAAGYDGTGVKIAVLDTGADESHPDLAGRIAVSRTFVPGQAVADGHGHGTHVAATVAGSGAASGGARKGVAPGAQLLVGKVLNNSGSSPISRVISGMEWAAVEQDADVVNMSLGTTGTDGTDPGSQAVNRLTSDTGALFVISAGNTGPGAETVGTPGVADAALTVAAVDKADQLAGFSGRGPRTGDGALKPDIAAPGVAIVAARAAGTSLGTPVDERYTSLNGTSMAAPHVAGAAAVLAQRHPEWTAVQLKPALMSTATDTGFTVYEQGAGRLDLARAIRQQVFAATPNVDFKLIRPPFDDDTLTRTIAYSNLGDQPVTLAIATMLETSAGGPAAGGALTASPSVTVPAGGTASVDVTLDPDELARDRYSGAVVATGPGGIRTTTPVGLTVGHELHTLTVNFIRRQKNAGPWLPTSGFVDSCITAFVVGVAGPGVDSHESAGVVCWNEPAAPSHPVTFEVPAGTYFASVLTEWHSGNLYRHAALINPEFEVADDTEIVLDADDAEEITIDTPQRSEVVDQWLTGMRTTTNGTNFQFGRFTTDRSKPSMWVTPTKRVTKGEFAFSPQYALAAPRVTVSLSKPFRATLHPFSHGLGIVGGQRDPLTFGAERRLQLVYAGDGTAEDFAKVDVRGKLVLLRVQTSPTPTSWWIPQIERAQLERAIAAGAEGLLFHSEQGILTEIRFAGSSTAPVPRIPFALLPAPEADGLLWLLNRGRVELTVGGTPVGESPFVYSLKPYEEGRVPSRLHYSFTKRNLVALDTHLHADEPNEQRLAFATWREIDGNFAFLVGYGGVDAPKRIPVFAGPLYDDALMNIHARVGTAEAGIDIGSYALTRAKSRDTHFFDRPQAPGVEGVPLVVPGHLAALCAACRQGDMFYPLVPLITNEQHRVGSVIGVGDEDVRLSRDGVELTRGVGALGLGYELPPEPARYRLTYDLEALDSTWDFWSSRVTQDRTPGGYLCLEALVGSFTACRPEPLIFLRYDADVSLDNTVRAGRRDEIRVTAHRQASTGPKIAGLKLWVSTDDGATWDQARVKSRGNGVFEADVRYPKLSQTTGAVSLKAEAWDIAGNRLEQTLTRAFGLRESHD